MGTITEHEEAKVGTESNGVAHAIALDGGTTRASRLTGEQVWAEIGKASFAVVGYVTPSGEPRSSGVVFKTVGRRLFVVVAPESWKARHIGASGKVSVTVPVRRGGVLSLVAPIPPATVSFHGSATVFPAGSPRGRSLPMELASLVPAESRASGSVIEITPEDVFVTYGVGVSLRKMRDPDSARARVPVT